MIKINKIDNYKEINKKLLLLIDKIPNNPLEKLKNNISHTDWNLPKETKREYLDYFFQIINPYMLNIAKDLNSKKFTISNAWFQQYYKLDAHPWHTHPECQFTNVYFVELPLKSLGTEILNEEKLDLNEGDLLTFPSYLYHRSPINLGDKRKTIISFNSNFEEYLY
jgi:mRNA-degrading endonuclease HigB of HigAB toxin-antitoxin module